MISDLSTRPFLRITALPPCLGPKHAGHPNPCTFRGCGAHTWDESYFCTIFGTKKLPKRFQTYMFVPFLYHFCGTPARCNESSPINRASTRWNPSWSFLEIMPICCAIDRLRTRIMDQPYCINYPPDYLLTYIHVHIHMYPLYIYIYI